MGTLTQLYTKPPRLPYLASHHPIFLYLSLEPLHPIHLVRPYGRLTLYFKLLIVLDFEIIGGFRSGHPFPALNTKSALTVLVVVLILGFEGLY